MNSNRLLFALRRWWPVFVGCVLVGLLAGMLYLKVTPDRYTARADVMIAVGGSDVSDLSSGSNFAQQQARNLSEIATRQRVLEPVVRRLSLPESASQLSQNVSATVPANTSIVTIEANYPSAVGAATIANAMADSLAQTARDLLPTVRKGGADIALRTIYQGSLPQAPSSPNTTTTLAFGLAAGLLVGLALLLLLEAIGRERSGASRTEAEGLETISQPIDSPKEPRQDPAARSGGPAGRWSW